MPLAGRVGDQAKNSTTGHESPAKAGSPDVLVDGKAALRVGDPGTDPESWNAQKGSTGVLINGLPAHRVGDATKHSAGDGQLVQGSPHLTIGDRGGGTAKPIPHDQTLQVSVKDALGRPIEGATAKVVCPHNDDKVVPVNGNTTLTGLCSSSTVTVNKTLQKGTWDPGASSGELVAPTHAQVEPPGKPEDATHVVHAPSPPATPPATNEVHIVKPTTPNAAVQLTTVHNWVELVFRAFGQTLPTAANEIAILGVREASLSNVAKGKLTVEQLEAAEAAGQTDKVETTRETRDADFSTSASSAHHTTWNDLLFIAYTDSTPAKSQHVEVFECTIDAGGLEAGKAMPITLEGKLYSGYPGDHAYSKYPLHNVCLHLYKDTPGKMLLAREVTRKYRVFTDIASAKNGTDWKFVSVESNDTIHMHFGGEGGAVGTWSTGCTVLHHHLWVKDKNKKNVVDPKATRYKRFMELFQGAPNKQKVPYLVVSSQYVSSFAEWARLAGQKPEDASKPASVIMQDKLRKAPGQEGHYLPSIMTTEFATAVNALAADKTTSAVHAANLKSSMDLATFTLSI